MLVICLMILLDVLTPVMGWSCAQPVRKVFVRQKSNASLHFNADIDSLYSPRTFYVKFYDGNLRAYIQYNTNRSYTSDALPGVTIKGDTLGHVLVTLENMQHDFAGTYYMESNGFNSTCVFLYILGKPTKPKIKQRRLSHLGVNTTLTCSATSTTHPTNHSLDFIYYWNVDNKDNPYGGKYTYSPRGEQIIISYIVKDDLKKQFTCSVLEDIFDGLRSVRSDPYLIYSTYGPDMIRFTPNHVRYNIREGENLEPVKCTANCTPTCKFKWTKIGESNFARNTPFFDLVNLSRTDAGTYRCIAIWLDIITITKDLEVNVEYGPDEIGFDVNSPYYVFEGDTHVTIKCTSHCHPECSYEWKNITDGHKLSSTGLLLLGEVTKYITGGYTCTVRSKASQKEKVFQKSLILVVTEDKPVSQDGFSCKNRIIFEVISVVLGVYAIGITILCIYCRGTGSSRQATSEMTRATINNAFNPVDIEENIHSSRDNDTESSRHYSDLNLYTRSGVDEYDVIRRELVR